MESWRHVNDPSISMLSILFHLERNTSYCRHLVGVVTVRHGIASATQPRRHTEKDVSQNQDVDIRGDKTHKVVLFIFSRPKDIITEYHGGDARLSGYRRTITFQSTYKTMPWSIQTPRPNITPIHDFDRTEHMWSISELSHHAGIFANGWQWCRCGTRMLLALLIQEGDCFQGLRESRDRLESTYLASIII